MHQSEKFTSKGTAEVRLSALLKICNKAIIKDPTIPETRRYGYIIPCEMYIFKICTDCSHRTTNLSHTEEMAAADKLILCQEDQHKFTVQHAQLPNDIIFIWFTDTNLFTLAMLKNSHNNRLYAPAVTKKKSKTRDVSE